MFLNQNLKLIPPKKQEITKLLRTQAQFPLETVMAFQFSREQPTGSRLLPSFSVIVS